LASRASSRLRAGEIALLCMACWSLACTAALAAAPAVLTVTPNNGPASGSSTVTIKGSGFLPGSTANFGAQAASGVKVDSAEQITATSPAGAGTADVTVSNADGASALVPGDQFAYDPKPTGPWLGLDGNSDGAWTGTIRDFTLHNIVYDRGGNPGLEWQAGELLQEGGRPTEGARALAKSVAAAMIPDIAIEYSGYNGDDNSDPNFPASPGQISSYVTGFTASASAIHQRYPTAIFEPMNEPWFFTTPKYNAAEYANVIARLLPAARVAGIPLDQIFIAGYGTDRNASGETAGGWIPAMYKAQPRLRSEIQGWYFHPYGPPSGSEQEKSLGIQSVAEVQELMSSGQNNIVVSEVGYCAPDVNQGRNCGGPAEAEDSTQAARRLTKMLDNALPYREAGWLRALIVYARADGGWAMQTPSGGLTRQGEALVAFADLHGSTSSIASTSPISLPAKPPEAPGFSLMNVACLYSGERDPFAGPCRSGD
jgi:IPT/TIG domain